VPYPDVPHPIERLKVAPPLRVLGMVASPQGLPQLDVGHEKRLVEEAVRGLQAKRLVELAWLEGQTWRAGAGPINNQLAPEAQLTPTSSQSRSRSVSKACLRTKVLVSGSARRTSGGWAKK
jgi:hypothetical protein